MNKKYISTPYLIWMAIFIFAPLCLVVYFAFTTPEGQFTMELPVIMPVSAVANIFKNPVTYIIIGVVAVGIAVAVILIVKKKK